MLEFPNHFCSFHPHPKQHAFLRLDDFEAFFGGAAGGGKSAALLMAALQYVDQPGYSALILRRDLPRLQLAGGLIPRSHEWLANADAKWNGNRHQWTFPIATGPPATLTFGYLSGPFDKFRYASSEYQYLGFDELTEIREDDYLFLFSRLRRVKTLKVPLRVRSASNPGNIGHLWVKQRFIPDDYWTTQQTQPADKYVKDGRIFIPSFIADNPSLSADEYLASLMHLPPLERERLARGDWSVQADGLFRPAWLRYYCGPLAQCGPLAPRAGSERYHGRDEASESSRMEKSSACGASGPHDAQLELLNPDNSLLVVIPEQACRRFATIDPAGTSAERAQESRGRPRSYTVVQVWDQPRARELSHFLLLRHQEREQVAFDGLCRLIRAVHSAWQPERIYIEDEKLGQAAVSILAAGAPSDRNHSHGRPRQANARRLAHEQNECRRNLPAQVQHDLAAHLRSGTTRLDRPRRRTGRPNRRRGLRGDHRHAAQSATDPHPAG